MLALGPVGAVSPGNPARKWVGIDMAGNQLPSVQYIVQLMLENRSFDHMLGLLYFGEWQCLARGSVL